MTPWTKPCSVCQKMTEDYEIIAVKDSPQPRVFCREHVGAAKAAAPSTASQFVSLFSSKS